MRVVALLKQTFDTEEKIVIENGAIQEEGARLIINPYDEYAIEEAIRIKELTGCEVFVVSVGTERTAEALRTALAMGADEAVLIADPSLPADEYSVSRALAAYLKSLSPDLILAGYNSVDNGAGQVAIRTASLLGLPHVSAAIRITLAESVASVERDAEGDVEFLTLKLPALITAQQGLNEPRYPSLPGIMKAKKKPLHQLTLADLGLDLESVAPRTERLSLKKPDAGREVQRLGGSPSEQALKLVSLLRLEAGVI